jgi:hypothetical protein
VVTESKEQLKRFILWDGGAVDNDAQLALLGAAGEGGTLFAGEAMSGELYMWDHASPRSARRTDDPTARST